ncbi:MAG: dienelactone hydrolase family protein [Fimbriimonadales bacterium]|nr:dienelactone hydrolase family protein [Fimbriimonadales bacterium]
MLIATLLFGTWMMSKPIVASNVEYRDGATVLEGYLAKPASAARAPIVLIVHDWNGIDAYEEGRARQIAELGYIGFAIDIYGKGVRPKDPQACAAEAQKYYRDHGLLMGRLNAALRRAGEIPEADRSRMAIMGYCFGGMVALEAARAGNDLEAAISFHGSLATQHPAQKGRTKARILVLHGGADPLVPKSDVEALKKEMANAGVPLRFVEYPGALHAFTVPGPEPRPGAAAGYNAAADKASWRELESFLRESFR